MPAFLNHTDFTNGYKINYSADWQQVSANQETELYKKLEAWQPEMVKQVRSVVGIGNVQQQF